MSKIKDITSEQIDIYASLASDLDKILSELTKETCAYECPRVEYEGEDSLRCCGSELVHKSAINSYEFLDRQMAEAFDNGWTGSTTEGCKYLVDAEGCSLKSYKSPLCLGFICPEIIGMFQEEYGPKGDEFSENMMAFGIVSDLKTELEATKTIERLEEVVNMGKELIQIKELKESYPVCYNF